MSSAPNGAPDDVVLLERERDLYLRLLELGHATTVTPFLREALGLLVDLTGAREGYIELYQDDDPPEAPRWSMAHGLTPGAIETVRATISRGIIAEAVAGGHTIVTPAALLDPRFSHRESVRRASIQAVLCTPVGTDTPRGVLYLTGHPGGRSFAEEDRGLVERVTRHLAPVVDRLLDQARREAAEDPTRVVREGLRLQGFVGRSPAVAALLREVAIAAPTSRTVLLMGETGTGKTQLARLIHENSPRHRGPFVEVSCTNLPEGIVESELFGAKRGAATGIDRDRVGYVAEAEHGTLFLDEIGDMSLEAQKKLLQLLESHRYHPLGQPGPVQADVRVIAGTNVDLRRAVADGRFRADLLFRLDVLTIRLPALAERRDDIRELAAFFCEEECRKEGAARIELSRDAIRALEAAEWPGNVRALANAVVRGVCRARFEQARQLERRHLDLGVTAHPASDLPRTFEQAVNEFKAQLLRRMLEETGWNVVETARRLDLARSHVYNLIAAFGLRREPRA